MPSVVESVIVDDFTLTSGNISNKYITLNRTPLSAPNVAVNVIKGTSQWFGVDYSVSGKQLSWNGLALESDLSSGDTLRVKYISEGAISSFATTPQRDDVPVTSTINTEVLIPLVDSDSYFDDESKLFRVDVTFVHSDTRQNISIMHLAPSLTGSASWSTFARSGTWRKMRLRLVDFDGAVRYVGRDLIGNDEDLTLS